MIPRPICRVLAGAVVLLSSAAAIAHAPKPRPTPAGCPTGDCIAHSIQSQVSCTDETHDPVGNSVGWLNGLSTNADQKILGGHIVAYQIKWSNGSWSSWYVPGQNDIDHKFNPGSNEMRRVWSYFSDHEHRYIVCR